MLKHLSLLASRDDYKLLLRFGYIQRKFVQISTQCFDTALSLTQFTQLTSLNIFFLPLTNVCTVGLTETHHTPLESVQCWECCVTDTTEARLNDIKRKKLAQVGAAHFRLIYYWRER